jgi:hypothetical protein
VAQVRFRFTGDELALAGPVLGGRVLTRSRRAGRKAEGGGRKAVPEWIGGVVPDWLCPKCQVDRGRVGALEEIIAGGREAYLDQGPVRGVRLAHTRAARA